MAPCPQCGAVPQSSDKFCNVCGYSLGPSPFGQAPKYGAPQQPHQGGLPPIDAMPFTNDAYGNPQGQQGGGFQQSGGYPAGQGGFPGGGGFGQPQGQYGGGYDQGGGGGFGQQPQGGFGGQQGGFPDPNAGFGGGGGFGQQPGQGQGGGGFGGGGFGQQQPQAPQQGFGGYPQQGQGFGGGGFDAQPPQPQFAPAPPPAPVAAAAPAYQPPPPQPLPATALRGFVVSYQANPAGEFWPLTGGRKVIGRANSGENVDIPLSDATTSSRHAALSIDGVSGTVTLEDTGSTNGTFVNEEHVGFNGRRDLRDGDKLRFGGYVAFVKLITRTH